MGNLFRLFLDNLLPIFLMAGAGYLLGKFLEIEARTISRAIFYVFSPCLIFNLLTTSELSNGDILMMFGYAGAHMLGLSLFAWILTSILGFERRLAVAVILTVMVPNGGNFGLSVNRFAFGESALAYASLYFVMVGIIANTVGVFIASLGKSSIIEAFKGLSKIPMIYAVVLALIFVGFGWALPLPLERTTTTLANAAIPSMLILLGLQFQRANWTGQTKALITAGSLRLAVSVGFAMLLVPLFGLQGAARQAGILQAGMPTAVVTTVLATEFDVEPAFVTFVVFATTLASPLTLTPLLAYLGG